MAHLSKRKVRKLEEAGDVPALIGWLRADRLDTFSFARISDALGRLRDPLAVDALLYACAVSADPERPLRALATIGDDRAVPALLALCQHWRSKGNEPGTKGPWNMRSYLLGVETMRELAGDVDGIRSCEEAMKEGWRRYHQVAWSDIAALDECPLCGTSWAARVEGAAQCSRCYRYFSNFDCLPHASDGSYGVPFGTLTGTSLWTMALTEFWLRYNDEREAEGLVRLPTVPIHMLMPTVESSVAWKFDEVTMGGALRGGKDQPPLLD
jgi:hypothetical protein